ncbi:anti-sigma factor family protein [Noviherbaspirillum massiliense]|uniref:anti-sigma factor family protein n=1 Tax=Noviherbaspirillum massiliense TaxID=1465823 RepID=UPI0002EC504E|nr:anti-sigma factor [Noviherbaspirillum massiliense]
MNCTEIQAKVHSYLDAELDASRRQDIDRHVLDCHDCARVYAEQQALDGILRKHAPRFEAPVQLRERIESALPVTGKKADPGRVQRPAWWSLAATAMLAVALTWGLGAYQRAAEVEEDFRDDAISVHRRSLLENHLVDVAETQAGRLASWFGRRLPYRVDVRDLSAQGYALVGGRLDYLYTRPLAAVVYRQERHVINVLIWPSSKSDDFPTSMMAEEGLRVKFFRKGSMNLCVISDLDQAGFDRFTQALLGA